MQTQDPKFPTYRGTFHCLFTIAKQESVSISPLYLRHDSHTLSLELYFMTLGYTAFMSIYQ